MAYKILSLAWHDGDHTQILAICDDNHPRVFAMGPQPEPPPPASDDRWRMASFSDVEYVAPLAPTDAQKAVLEQQAADRALGFPNTLMALGFKLADVAAYDPDHEHTL